MLTGEGEAAAVKLNKARAVWQQAQWAARCEASLARVDATVLCPTGTPASPARPALCLVCRFTPVLREAGADRRRHRANNPNQLAEVEGQLLPDAHDTPAQGAEAAGREAAGQQGAGSSGARGEQAVGEHETATNAVGAVAGWQEGKGGKVQLTHVELREYQAQMKQVPHCLALPSCQCARPEFGLRWLVRGLEFGLRWLCAAPSWLSV